MWVWAWVACKDDDSTGPDGTIPSGPVLVVPQADGLDLLRRDGTVVGGGTWTDLVGTCAGCGGEGANPDGDGLLVSFTLGGDDGQQGGVARLTGDLQLDGRVDGFAFPHDLVRDPADGTLIVAETGAHRLAWIRGDAGSARPVRELGEDTPGFAPFPNGLVRFDHDGRTYALLSHHGSAAPPGTMPPSGRIALWDLTDAGAPSLVWLFPEDGPVDTPHHPILRVVDSRWWLVWAHTYGHGNDGCVGLAVTDDPLVRPTYVADLVPADTPFVYLRGVEIDEDGLLLVTDSGEGGTGRILRASFPSDLEPTGATGIADEDQVFVDFPPAELVAEGLAHPFEAWWWYR